MATTKKRRLQTTVLLNKQHQQRTARRSRCSPGVPQNRPRCPRAGIVILPKAGPYSLSRHPAARRISTLSSCRRQDLSPSVILPPSPSSCRRQDLFERNFDIRHPSPRPFQAPFRPTRQNRLDNRGGRHYGPCAMCGPARTEHVIS